MTTEITRDQVKAVLGTKGLKSTGNYTADRTAAELIIRMDRDGTDRQQRIDAMPEWARAAARYDGCTDVTVAAKVEAEGLTVDGWTSKRGAEMHLVHWQDGTCTQYSGSLEKQWIAFDANL